MSRRLDLYINSDCRPCVDELVAMAHLKNEKVSVVACRAISEYVNKMKNNPEIIINKCEWDAILKDKSRAELLELDTLITGLHRKVIERLCKKQ